MILRLGKALVTNYFTRHRKLINKLLHIVGVPLVFLAIFQLFRAQYKFACLNLFIGYLLQWIGHTFFEKNEVGEWILIKKLANKLTGR